MITLRPYQNEPVRKAIEYMQGDCYEPSLIVLPTAWGKSILAAYVAASTTITDRLLVVQPTKELLEQNYNKFIALCGEEGKRTAGIFSASFGKKEIGKITFATIGSIKNLGQEFLKRGFTKMLIDEAHMYPRREESMLGGFIRDSCMTKVLGITATPFKLEQFNMKRGEVFNKWSELIMLTNPSPSGTFFKRIIHVGQIQEMTRLGFWSPLRYEVMPFDTTLLKMNTSGSEFSEKSMEEEYRANRVKEKIYGALNWHSERKHCLVFVPNVECAEELARGYPGSAVVSSGTKKKERQEIIDSFRKGVTRVLFNVNMLTCLVQDTEILTRKGWRTWKDISQEDQVAQYDWQNNEISFEHPYCIIHKNFTGNMVKADNKYMSLNITEDHTMLFTTKTTNNKLKPIQKTEAGNLVNKKRIFIPVNGNSKPENITILHTIKCSRNRFISQNSYNYRKKGLCKEDSRKKAEELYEQRISESPKNPSELKLDECRFIGFWLGDGSIHHTRKGNKLNGKRYNICQSTANPGMIIWIENILESCKIHYTRQVVTPKNTILGRVTNAKKAICYNLWKGTGGDKQHVESNLHKLEPYLKKSGTELYWGLNKEQFKAVIEGLWKANGNHGDNKRYNGQGITSSNKELIDLLQAIGTCRGYRITANELKPTKTKRPLYQINVSDKHYHEFVKDLLKTREVRDEPVWCVTMPKGTIVTRNKGRVSILGNCGFDYPEIDLILTAVCTCSVAKYMQILGRGVRIHPDKKDCLIIDMGGNYERFGRVEDIFYKLGERWRMYGTDGRLLAGIPINCTTEVTREDINRIRTAPKEKLIRQMPSGKFRNYAIEDIPMYYRTWYLKNMKGRGNDDVRDAIILSMEETVRDTRNEPPAGTLPDGQYAGIAIDLVPRGYLRWYYNSQEWNECNDHVRRGIEQVYGDIPHRIRHNNNANQ